MTLQTIILVLSLNAAPDMGLQEEIIGNPFKPPDRIWNMGIRSCVVSQPARDAEIRNWMVPALHVCPPDTLDWRMEMEI